VRQSADPALFHANPGADGELSVSYQGWDATKTVLAGQRLWSRGARGRYRRALSSAGGRSPRTGAQRRFAARSLGGVTCLVPQQLRSVSVTKTLLWHRTCAFGDCRDQVVAPRDYLRAGYPRPWRALCARPSRAAAHPSGEKRSTTRFPRCNGRGCIKGRQQR